LSLVIHDDGTLNPQDQELLLSTLDGAIILSKTEADSMVDPFLTHHPNCRAYRRNHPLALKLIDMPLIEQDSLAYCDSDILFLKSFVELFSWPDEHRPAIFMQDLREPYALRPWHVYPMGDILVPRKVNTGLIYFRTSKFDLDFVEWFLGHQRLREIFIKRTWWIEQTCWAALGWQVGCRMWEPRQLLLAGPTMKMTRDVVGIHFVATYRNQLDQFVERTADVDSDEEPTVIRSRPARLTSPLRLLVSDVVKTR
jgi:hypothetical protein